MVERKPNEVKIVGWLLVAKKLIKFANDETSYKISDNVMAKSNFDKFPLKKGDTVEVSIAEGVVTYIRKQKSDAPKAEGYGSEEAYEPTPEEEAGPTPKVEAVDTRLDKPTPAPTPKVEAPKVEGTTSTVLTVFAVAANKKVVKFLECKDAGWFQIDEAIQAQDYKVIGLEARHKANVKIVENKVVSFAELASEPAEQPKTATSSQGDVQSERIATPSTTSAPAQAAKKEWKPYNAQGKDDYWTNKFEHDKAHFNVKESEKQLSIEAQAAVNSANEVAGRVAASISPAPTANVINNMIRAVAESNFALIQELKSK